MNRTILRFHSITFAMKAQRTLAQAGIRSIVRRSTARYSGAGCSFSLLADAGPARVLALMEQNQIPYLEPESSGGNG